MLELPDAWPRETSHRLIFERQDTEFTEPLRKMSREGKTAQAQIHALWSLEAHRVLRDFDDITVIRFRHARVREQIARIFGPYVEPDLIAGRERASFQSETDDRRLNAFSMLSADADARVRFQTVLSAGEMGVDSPAFTTLLERIARQDASDPWIRAAITSSSATVADRLLLALMRNPGKSGPASTVRLQTDLAVTVGAAGNPEAIELVLIFAASPTTDPFGAFAVAAGIGDGLQRAKRSLADVISRTPSAAGLFDRAASATTDKDEHLVIRAQAVELLRHAPFEQARDAILPLLDPRHPAEVQLAAVRAMGSFSDAALPALLLPRRAAASPVVRAEILEILLRRAAWIPAVLDAVEAGTIAVTDLPTGRRSTLQNHADPKIRDRAVKLFASPPAGERTETLARYQKAVADGRGDRTKGREAFLKNCATCHTVAGVGTSVGPDLGSIRHRSPEELVIHILDPNREVAPDFVGYVVSLKDERILTGIIAAEAGSAVTLRRAGGEQDVVLRDDIAAMANTGKSLMPEGLEKAISPEEMRDLVEFLRSPE